MLSTQAALRTDLFISAKTSTAIPARHPLVRDALVQASLDPRVRSLDYISSAPVGTAQVKKGSRRTQGSLRALLILTSIWAA
jgi:hypothetical protein